MIMSFPDSEARLQAALNELVGQTFLKWQQIPNLPLQGYLLDLESASRPLDPQTSERVMHAPPFWGLLWPAGHLLCRTLTRHPHLVKDRSCVDLGCGSGLVAVALARAGAHVVAADSDPMSCEVTRLHLERHKLRGQVTSRWDRQAQTLFLADFLYDESNLDSLSAFQEQADEIVVVDCRLEELSRPGFHLLGQRSEVAFPDLDPHREFGTVRIWYFGPRKPEWEEAFEIQNP
jgi:predicted nicotinamide N-methyase